VTHCPPARRVSAAGAAYLHLASSIRRSPQKDHPGAIQAYPILSAVRFKPLNSRRSGQLPSSRCIEDDPVCPSQRSRTLRRRLVSDTALELIGNYPAAANSDWSCPIFRFFEPLSETPRGSVLLIAVDGTWTAALTPLLVWVNVRKARATLDRSSSRVAPELLLRPLRRRIR